MLGMVNKSISGQGKTFLRDNGSMWQSTAVKLFQTFALKLIKQADIVKLKRH